MKEWGKVEKRFLNSSGPGLSNNSQALMREERLHPLNWGRLPPLLWDLDRRRLALMPMIWETQQEEWWEHHSTVLTQKGR